MPITAHGTQQKAGVPHSAVVKRDATNPIGRIVFDPVRNQFSFHPDDENLVLTAADNAAILALLNTYVK